MTLLESTHEELVGASGAYETNAEYHRNFDHLSHSMKEVFRRSPRLYRAYVTREMEWPEPTDEMKLGTALHAAILEPERAADVYCVEPAGINKRTNAGRAAMAAFEAELEKKKLVGLSVERAERLEHMRAAVLEHPGIKKSTMLISPGHVERSILWVDPETGIKCKCRPDKYWDCSPEPSIVIDLKTTTDPSPDGFKQAVGRLGYYRQAAWYLEGLGQGLGIFGAQFLFIAVGKEAPWDVGVYELDDIAIDIGRRQNAAILRDMRACQDSGDWRAYWEKDIQTLSVPGWVRYTAEQEQS